MSQAFVGPSYFSSRVCFYGQSLLLLPLAAPFPEQATTGLGVPRPVEAALATGWAGLASGGYLTQMLRQPIAANNVLVCQGGQTDLFGGTSGADTYTLLAGQVAQARTAGFDHVIATTCPPTAPLTGNAETERLAYNAALLADASSAFDDVVDLAGDPRLADNTDTTYFDEDETHVNATGAGVMAELARPAIMAGL